MSPNWCNRIDTQRDEMMILKLAWRNVLRNKRRTLLSGTAIGIGLAALIFTDALMVGMEGSMIRSATDTYLGHGQIHAKGFRDTLEVEKTITRSGEILIELSREPEVKSFAPRTQSYAMITSAANVSSIMVTGIAPDLEKELSRIDDAVIKGEYLENGDKRRILIGSRLAETLEVVVGDRIVLTAAQALSGEIAQEMFRVGGIFRFNVKEMDNGMAFIEIGKSSEMLGLGNGVHEIAFTFHDIGLASDRASGLWEKYSHDNNEALGWRDLLKELDALLEMSQYTKYILAVVLFGIVSLIIINTMFMSLYERLFEFGILRAVGTRPHKMAAIVLTEAASLSAVSVIIGMAIGLCFSWFYSWYGIDYRGVEFADVTFRELIYPVITIRQYIEYPLWVMAFSLIAGLYPAVYAARLIPSKVLRRSL